MSGKDSGYEDRLTEMRDRFQERMNKIDADVDANKHALSNIEAKLQQNFDLYSLIVDMKDQIAKAFSNNVMHVANHSITQELIDMGAYDVAKSYIDFLMARAERPILVGWKTVSPVGKKTMKKNNGADFGPDTKGTKTSGIQEAINKENAERKKGDQ